VCEQRHTTQPRINLPCGSSLNLGLVANGGRSFVVRSGPLPRGLTASAVHELAAGTVTSGRPRLGEGPSTRRGTRGRTPERIAIHHRLAFELLEIATPRTERIQAAVLAKQPCPCQDLAQPRLKLVDHGPPLATAFATQTVANGRGRLRKSAVEADENPNDLG
jgi:hypothetical protein